MWVTSDVLVHLRLLQAQVADALEQPLAGAEAQEVLLEVDDWRAPPAKIARRGDAVWFTVGSGNPVYAIEVRLNGTVEPSVDLSFWPPSVALKDGEDLSIIGGWTETSRPTKILSTLGRVSTSRSRSFHPKNSGEPPNSC
jgi:hypothetical protein